MPLGRGFKGLIYRPTLRTLDDRENSIHDEEKGGVKAPAPATTTSTTTAGSTGTTALSTTTTTNSNKETHRSNKKKRTIYDDDDNDSVEDGERVALSCFQELSARLGSCRWRFEIYRPSSTVARTMLHHRVMQSKVGEEDEEFTKEDKEKAQQYKKFEEDRLRWERYSWRPLFEDSVYYPDQEDLNDAIDAYREAKLKASNTFGVHQPRVRLGRIATLRKSFSEKWQRYKKRNEDEEDEEDEDDEEEGDEEKQKQRQKEKELMKQQQLEEQKKQQQLQQQMQLTDLPPNAPVIDRSALGVFRSLTAHFSHFHKLIFLIIYTAVAVAIQGRMQLTALMVLLAIYFLYLIFVTPMRNPFLQQEILFTGALFLMFGLLYAAFD